jgi:hypothetical protein
MDSPENPRVNPGAKFSNRLTAFSTRVARPNVTDHARAAQTTHAQACRQRGEAADNARQRCEANSSAWYVMIRSAPARLIDVRISFITRGPSIQSRSAAAFTIEYSPLTL